MEFNEAVFLKALTARPVDMQRFSDIFKPEWLMNIAYRPILVEMYNFTKKKGIPPSVETLEEIFKEKNKESYEFKIQPVLEKLKTTEVDVSFIIHTLDKAKDIAIVRSLNELVQSQDILKAAEEGDGHLILTKVNQWINHFANSTDEQSMTLKESIDQLLKSSVYNTQSKKIPSGILPIDEWTNGGLRTKELGILMSPTGHGKSVTLMNMAYKMAMMDELPVWFITNELTMEEQTERFLARLTQSKLAHVQVDPYTAYEGMGKHWNITNRIRLTSVNRTVSTTEMEAMMLRWANISGWMPKVIVVDFMERMKPNDKGYSRDKEWTWLGAIALDLVRFAKRHNVLVWSAAQTNRGGLTSDEINISHVQGSIRHLQEATAVVGMRRRSMDKEKDTVAMEFFSLKMRSSKQAFKKKIIDVSLDKMYISKTELDDPDEVNEEKVQQQTTPPVTVQAPSSKTNNVVIKQKRNKKGRR